MNPQQSDLNPNLPQPQTQPNGQPGLTIDPQTAAQPLSQPAPVAPTATPQATAAAPSGYDFILNAPTASKPKTAAFKVPKSMASKLLMGLGLLFVIVVLLGVGMKLLKGGNAFDKPTMLSVAQDQTELIHLAQNATGNAVSASTKNYTYTILLTVQSQQAAFNTYLKSNNYVPTTALLNQKVSTATDKQLTDAVSSSNFDSVFKTIIQAKLTTYQNDLSTAYNKAGTNGKTILKADYQDVKLLLSQLSAS